MQDPKKPLFFLRFLNFCCLLFQSISHGSHFWIYRSWMKINNSKVIMQLTMIMTGPQKLSWITCITMKLDSLKATFFKVLQFHLPIASFHSKKLPLLSDSIFIWNYSWIYAPWNLWWYLRHSWNKNYPIWLTKSIFDLSLTKIFKSSYILLQSTSACKKLCWLIWLLLRYSWLRSPEIWLAESNFDHAQVKLN